MLHLLRRNPLRITPQLSPSSVLLRFLHESTITSSDADTDDDASFTVSYLTTACGLPIPDAVSAASHIRLRPSSTSKTDSVLALLRSYNFSRSQMAAVFHKHPNLLLADPDTTIRPKLDFFLDYGYSQDDLVNLVSADPNLLRISLANRLIPNFEILQKILGSKEHVMTAIRGSSRLLRYKLEKMMLPNVETLKSHGLPAKNIVQLATAYPRVMTQNSDRFAHTVEKLKELGINPWSTTFILGINAMSGLTTSTWQRKLSIYRSFGWSEKDTLLAFTRHPFCMLASDEKIKNAMEFFMKKLQWDPLSLLRRPKLISLSLEKRIIPRCAVLNVLALNNLSSQWKTPVHTVLMMTEKEFQDRYVLPYGEQFPEVNEAYQGNIEFVEMQFKPHK
ncbi:uncharacterized protein [Typha angustifolia]|uniref:uncharacterized protein n=1 Tax=Typha angustifolia TaxID=59011 RepID=UPI003C2D3EEB